MVESGKKLFILQKLLPDCGDHLLIGYRKKQMEDCIQHEATIWNFFLQNNLLQSIDKNVYRDYVQEGPKTQELGEDAPGNIGSFVGWQIVKKYMSIHEELDLTNMMQTDPDEMVREAKYKP